MYLVYGYPATLESVSVDAYLAIAGGSYNGQYWTYDDGVRRYTIRQFEDGSGFYEGLAAPGSIVVYAGHSNFGLGASFDPQTDHSEVEYIETVDDFFHYGSETVAINYELLRDNQAYPNFVLRPQDVVQNPENYLVPYMNVERFPNDQGVGPGDTFGIIGYDNSGNPYHLRRLLQDHRPRRGPRDPREPGVRGPVRAQLPVGALLHSQLRPGRVLLQRWRGGLRQRHGLPFHQGHHRGLELPRDRRRTQLRRPDLRVLQLQPGLTCRSRRTLTWRGGNG
jgi:hypothetical protein